MTRRTRGINKRSIRLIRGIVAERRPDLVKLVDALPVDGLSDDLREVLRGIIADELVDKGLSEDDEPTPYGLVLEDLIDWLGTQ